MTQRTSRQTAQSSALQAWIRALDYTSIMQDGRPVTMSYLLDELVDIHGERPALLSEGEQFTYRDLAAQSNRYARWTMTQGLAKGDVVCLLMPNRAEYVAIWVGVTRVGCAVALINSNLSSEALLHAIHTAKPTHLIVASALLSALTAIADRLPAAVHVWVHGEAAPCPWRRIEPEIAMLSAGRLDNSECLFPAPADQALLIYTSGTTGLPKAAYVTHRRVMEWSLWFAGMMDAQPVDRLYNCLPMYHSIGGVVAIGAMLVRGGSVLIRQRFSASRFWDDIAENECTIFQYIGELCRYLFLSPPHPRERQHHLRLACGNGLQGEVWKDFQTRFAIPRILEYYAATEGVISLYNCEGNPGAIGRIPSFLAHRFPVALIKCDTETSVPLRDAAGFCVTCGVDESGEAIGQLPQGTDPSARRFDGYTDLAASERKILRNVFAKGDVWYRSGDLLRRDSAGFFYFVDRLGDTYRWRGENVSTTQVAEVLRACPGVTDAIVYGVTVTGNEGRAGMAAITTDDRFDFATLRTHLAARLPVYSHPLFIRRRHSLDATETFKPVKGALVQEGYAGTADPVWFNDHCLDRFIFCDATLVQTISNGKQRL